MASTTVTIQHSEDLQRIIAGNRSESMQALSNAFAAFASGMKRAASIDIWTGTADMKSAYGTVVASAVDAADTVSLNGKALTATQHHATGTVTCSSVDVSDAVTINGVTFTAAAAENIATGAFNQSGTDTACATSLVACINGSTDPLISGVVTASSALGVVTVRAVTAGTGGNSITLSTTDGTDLAVSDTTLANGAAVGAEEFDYVGTNTQTATAIALALNSSTDSALQYLVEACNISGSFVLSNAVAGNYAIIRVTGVGEWRFTGGTDWTVTGTDTQDGTSLESAINGANILNRYVVAINTSGTVRIYQRSGTSVAVTLAAVGTPITVTAMAARERVLFSALQPGIAGNTVTLASSDGTDLAVSGARLSGGTGGSASKVSFTR